MMTTIADRLHTAQQRIELAAHKYLRSQQEIKLLAVSKTKQISQIIAAYQAGQRFFGENYVQEGQSKITELKPLYPDIEWHFIGPLQSNKSRIVAEHFDWIHTVSRDKIAQRLSEQRPLDMAPLNVCIQINISKEKSKSGTTPEQVLPLADCITALPNLRLRGLMAIPTDTDDTAQQESEFAALKQCFDTLKQHYPEIDTLSMGMSGDMEQAIAHGSTMVRIGSAIFGARD